VVIDPELRRYVQLQRRLPDDRLAERLNHDKQAGLMPDDLDPELVVPIIVTYLQGL
jgi:hypothetical protein